MLNSILFFEQFCIKNFEKLEDEFLKNPISFAEYVMLRESAFRQKSRVDWL
ncbi:MAG: hypothetical protein HFI81_06040 [Eubacterium sp.]|jgi:hypothetical protein|nr:hypothetical protein [Eubacterium sp.]